MYKISNEVRKLIEKTMKTWRPELTAGGKSVSEVKIQWSIFQEDILSLLFKTCTGGYKLSKSQENINHLMRMDDIKLSAKNEKELETLIQAVRI